MKRDCVIGQFLDKAKSMGVTVKMFRNDSVARVNFDLKTTKLTAIVFFDRDGDTAQIMGVDFVEVPIRATDRIYEIIAKFNKKYRWIKLLWDEKKAEVYIQTDVLFSGEDRGVMVWDYLNRMCEIVNSIYPELIHEFWGDIKGKKKTVNNESGKTLDQLIMSEKAKRSRAS